MSPVRLTLVSGLGANCAAAPNEGDQYAPPLGILMLAALLRDQHPVTVLDLDDFWRRASYRRPQFHSSVVDSICGTKPDVIGFSSISGSYPLTLRLAEECSRVLPEATIVFGGPQATVTDVETMSAFPFVDLILRGEADDTFPELINALASGSRVTRIAGLTFRENRRVRRNASASAILDLDRLPLPAYDLVPRIGELSAFALEIGRGCPYACTFCSTNDFFRRRFRLKSPAKVLEQMNLLNATWGVTTFDLVHDMFTVDRKRVADFCETMIAAGSPYKWGCSARTDSVDSELLQLMKRAGCHSIFFGVETGSQRMQRIIDKDLDLTAARRILRENNRLEILTTASLIIGYPQETKEDLRDTIGFFSDAMLLPWVDPQLNILSPLAATPITNEYIGQLTLDENWTQISEVGGLQDGVDRLLIAAHPDIFPHFYAFPFFTSRDLLQHLRDFLCFGLSRCGGLIRAVYLHTNDLLAVFEEWMKSAPNPAPEWFGSLDFVSHLISFCETTYPESRSIMATARFYRDTFRATAHPRVVSEGSEPYLALSDNLVLVDCDTDINAVLEALAQGRQPDTEALTTPVSVGVRFTALNRASILRFPPITMDLLRHAERASTLAEIECDFEARNVTVSGLPSWKVAVGGIDYLEKQKLARRVYAGSQWAGATPPEQVLTGAC